MKSRSQFQRERQRQVEASGLINLPASSLGRSAGLPVALPPWFVCVLSVLRSMSPALWCQRVGDMTGSCFCVEGSKMGHMRLRGRQHTESDTQAESRAAHAAAPPASVEPLSPASGFHKLLIQ